jgi:hypothetical protein
MRLSSERRKRSGEMLNPAAALIVKGLATVLGQPNLTDRGDGNLDLRKLLAGCPNWRAGLKAHRNFAEKSIAIAAGGHHEHRLSRP